MRRHKQWHWNVEEKRGERDARIQKEKEKLKELERQKDRENLKRKEKRKGRPPKAMKSSPAKIIMTGEWPSVPSTSSKTLMTVLKVHHIHSPRIPRIQMSICPESYTEQHI